MKLIFLNSKKKREKENKNTKGGGIGGGGGGGAVGDEGGGAGGANELGGNEEEGGGEWKKEGGEEWKEEAGAGAGAGREEGSKLPLGSKAYLPRDGKRSSVGEGGEGYVWILAFFLLNQKASIQILVSSGFF